MPNSLEDAICAGIIDAQKKYYQMTGHLLRHAPEAFLSTVIAMTIYKKLGCSVYMDAALSRIAREREESQAGREQTPKIFGCGQTFRFGEQRLAVFALQLKSSARPGRLGLATI